MNQVKQIPTALIVVAVLAVLGLAGFFMYRTVQSQNGSYTVPMDRARYQERMREQAQSNSSYYKDRSQSGQAGQTGGAAPAPAPPQR